MFTKYVMFVHKIYDFCPAQAGRGRNYTVFSPVSTSRAWGVSTSVSSRGEASTSSSRSSCRRITALPP